MKETKTKIRFLILTLLIAAAMAAASWASPSRKVYDQADLFTDYEEEQLEGYLADLIGKMNMDFVVVTVDNKAGKSQAAYADDFYDNGSFGMGDDRAGLLFMIDMEDRDCYISTSGGMIDYLTDSRIQAILQEDDELWERLGSGLYADGVLRVMDDVEQYYEEGPDLPGNTKKSFSPLTLLGSLLVGAFAGFSKSRSIRNEYGMKNEQEQALASTKAYMATTAFAFNTSMDDLIDRHVTRIPIPRQTHSGGGGGSHPHSSTHMSSSGRTHGGGGSGGRHF
jgi:uncharacterized protein